MSAVSAFSIRQAFPLACGDHEVVHVPDKGTELGVLLSPDHAGDGVTADDVGIAARADFDGILGIGGHGNVDVPRLHGMHIRGHGQNIVGFHQVPEVLKLGLGGGIVGLGRVGFCENQVLLNGTELRIMRMNYVLISTIPLRQMCQPCQGDIQQ